jgi:hypothetical protein
MYTAEIRMRRNPLMPLGVHTDVPADPSTFPPLNGIAHLCHPRVDMATSRPLCILARQQETKWAADWRGCQWRRTVPGFPALYKLLTAGFPRLHQGNRDS